MAEQLVAAADCEEGRPGCDCLAQCLAFAREVTGNEYLLPILSAADVEDIDPVGDGAAEADRHYLELVPSGTCALA